MLDNFKQTREFFSKFLHLRRMEENFGFLDYTKFDPKKSIVFDVDLTILEAINRDYENAIPFPDMISKINKLHDEGWTIILYTARGQLSKNGNMIRIEKENRPVLEKWLKDHDVHYDYLLFNKPFASFYVDDKALRPSEFLSLEF